MRLTDAGSHETRISLEPTVPFAFVDVGYGETVIEEGAAHLGADAIRVWAQHRTTGRCIHVYAPADPALFDGLASYKATRHLVQAQFAEAA